MAVMGFNAILGKISFYWQYPFVRYALVVGVLIALCSSLLGVTLVLRRFSFIGDGLSHVAFGAMTIATVLKMTEKMPLIMGITIVSAVLLLRTGQNTKIKGDAMMAMISVGALAIGYSTARDMARLACAAVENETLVRMASTRSVTIGGRTMTNHNKLLNQIEAPDRRYGRKT